MYADLNHDVYLDADVSARNHVCMLITYATLFGNIGTVQVQV